MFLVFRRFRLIPPPSLQVAGGLTDVAMQRLSLLRRSTALIIGMGSSTRSDVLTPQARYDVLKAGFLAAAKGDPRCIWIDNSPSGEAHLYGPVGTGNVSTWFGPTDTYHLNNVGMPAYGRRLGQSIIHALNANRHLL